MKNIYLDRYAWPDKLIGNYSSFGGVFHIIVIPAYKESMLLSTLNALNACAEPDNQILILVVINESENAPLGISEAHQKTYEEIANYDSKFPLEVLYIKLPEKKAGVGLARKVGMDEAVRIFEHHQTDGIITCFDADCSCSANYLRAIEAYFENGKKNLGLLYYEHPTDGPNAEFIVQYEIFLRYYVNALRWAHYPFAFQTLGSCISVKSKAYQKQGGMNTRKAGEDFYFIHKTMPIGEIGEINEACVFPSDRVSDRVPFGTGHAVQKQLDNQDETYFTYAPKCFIDLKSVFENCNSYYKYGVIPQNTPESIQTFYTSINFQSDLGKIIQQSNNLINFQRKFFTWWDGFKVLKYIHFARDHFYPNIPLLEATEWIGENYINVDLQDKDNGRRLEILRSFDRMTNFKVSGKGLLRPADDTK